MTNNLKQLFDFKSLSILPTHISKKDLNDFNNLWLNIQPTIMQTINDLNELTLKNKNLPLFNFRIKSSNKNSLRIQFAYGKMLIADLLINPLNSVLKFKHLYKNISLSAYNSRTLPLLNPNYLKEELQDLSFSNKNKEELQLNNIDLILSSFKTQITNNLQEISNQYLLYYLLLRYINSNQKESSYNEFLKNISKPNFDVILNNEEFKNALINLYNVMLNDNQTLKTKKHPLILNQLETRQAYNKLYKIFIELLDKINKKTKQDGNKDTNTSIKKMR